MRRLLALGFAATTIAASAQVVPPNQHDGEPSVSTGSVPLTYTGGDTRVSVGVDQDGNTQGELLGVFGDNGEHAFVGQLWWTRGGAGGVQGDWNWLWGTTLEQARRDPDSVTVAKLSFAIDQNAEKARQANVGFAIERKEYFLDFFLSGKASGARNAGAITTQTQTTTTGTDAVGNYTQIDTELATTPLQAQPYSYTVGVHGGHFSDALTARFNGGFDYSRGNDGAHELRSSIGVDKYLGVRGWSVSALAEHASLSNGFEPSRTDNRWMLMLRYEFGGGGAFQPAVQGGDAAWLGRALRNPVSGHLRTVDTYVRRSKTTTKTTQGPKQYTAHRPVPHDDAASVDQDSGASTIDVLANDSDPDGTALTLTAVTAPAHGSAAIAGGKVAYTPAQGYHGSDSFDYTVTNTAGLAASAHVAITVNAVTPPPPPPPDAQPPVARNDSATTANATPVTIPVLANDTDPYGYALTVLSASPPGHGSARVNADGSITYTPSGSYAGGDAFSYTIGDGHGKTATALVTITVLPPLPPVANDDAATTAFDTPVTIDVLANDTDPYHYFLTVTSASPPTHGSASVGPGGAITYTPALHYVGTDSFLYTISDGHGGLASANVTVTVLPPGTKLVAQNDTASTAFAAPVAINVLANDSGPSGLTLTVTAIQAQPVHGTAQIGANGIVTYKPANTLFGGTDAFSYVVSDGVESATATVTVTVAAPLPPVAVNDTASTAFQTPVVIDVLANDTDPNGLPLTITEVGLPNTGTAQISGNKITYTPGVESFSGATFTYTISNGHAATASATVTVAIAAPVPPVANPDSATTAFNTPVTINVLANDSDPNNKLPLQVQLQGGSTPHGSIALNTNNTITYTPSTDYQGQDSFTYLLLNSQGAFALGTVTVTVQGPLPPVAKDDSASIPYNTSAVINVLANDTDPNSLPLTITMTTQPAHGTVAPDPGGLKYTPGAAVPPFGGEAAPYVGADSFSYTISDGFHTATATVSVNVQLPPPPTAVNDSADCSIDGNEAVVLVLANDIDPTGLGLQLVSASAPMNPAGQVGVAPATTSVSGPAVTYFSADPSNQATYTSDSFTYTIRDVYGQTAVGNVAITIVYPGP